MDATHHLEAVRRAGARISEVGAGADLKAPVPSMPGNDLGTLLLHTGAFCRWARTAATASSMPEVDYSDMGDDVLAWHEREHAALVDTLESAGPAAPAWSWGDDQRAAFWFRRAAHELSVHCWDAENTVGEPAPIQAGTAADGIDELLDEFGPRREIFDRPGAAGLFGGDGETLHLHATDVDGGGEWLVVATPETFEVTREHGKGDVAAKGTASDLQLFLWGRVAQDDLEVFGDASLLHRWQERVRI